MKIVNGRVRDDKGRPFAWRWRQSLDRLDDKPGVPAWVCVYPSFSAFIFGNVARIVGPTYPGREQMIETYRLPGELADIKLKVRAALDRRQVAWLLLERPLSHPSFIEERRRVNRALPERLPER